MIFFVVDPDRYVSVAGGSARAGAASGSVGGDSRALSDWIALPELLHAEAQLEMMMAAEAGGRADYSAGAQERGRGERQGWRW